MAHPAFASASYAAASHLSSSSTQQARVAAAALGRRGHGEELRQGAGAGAWSGSVVAGAAPALAAGVLTGLVLGLAGRRPAGRGGPAKGRRAPRRAAGIVPTVDGLMIKPDECRDLLGSSRPVHWVIRTSNLEASLDFLAAVFGMRVLRHEENDEPCAITCNGDFETPWSKTMVGYGPEDEGYCLELTYNYGISGYDAGSGLAHMAVGVDDVDAALSAAAGRGFSVDRDMVTGPDGYKFRVVQQQPERRERFQYVALRTSSVPKAVEFYEMALGMKDLSTDFESAVAYAGGSSPTAAAAARALGYSASQVPLLLFEDPAAQDREPGQWEGRNAVCVPGRAMRGVYKRLLEDGHGGGVLHPIREFNELPALRRSRGLPPMPCSPAPEDYLRALRKNPKEVAPTEGTLAVAVMKDADGYEVCLVSAEAYNAAVANAYDPEGQIDWEWRKEAHAGRRTPAPQHMLKCV